MAQSWSQRCLIEGAKEDHCGAMMDQSWSQRCLIEGAKEDHCGAMMDQSWSQRCLIVNAIESHVVEPSWLKVGAKGVSLKEPESLIGAAGCEEQFGVP
jgi:hypothetical protein